MKRLLILLFAVVAATAAQAQLSMPTFFSDNMVLQQQSEAALWGVDEPNRKIQIKSSWGESASTVTDADGNWRCTITTLKADNKPQSLTIKGSETKQIENIMFGEVWFCSGQSNMDMRMVDTRKNRQIAWGANEDVLLSKNPSIRHFSGKTLASDTLLTDSENGVWYEASPATTANFTSVGYYFARRLNEVLDIPIGIIHSSRSGSPIESWMDRVTLNRFPDYSYTERESHKAPFMRPTTLYNSMINPYIGYTIKGFLWYQGESNCKAADEYADLFKAMVELWRERWGMGDLPFYYVQIAPFIDKSKESVNSAFLREQQMEALNMVENVGMVSTMDIGESVNIHPGRKKEVGERLALWAFAKLYGLEEIGFSGPIYKSMEVKGSRIIISFDYGINMLSYDKEMTGFEIAGADRVFYPATTGYVDAGSQLAVFSKEVPEPVAVRYCFKRWCVGSLYNVYDLPASSFRTDDWDDVGVND